MADLVIGLSKTVVEGALTKVQSAIEEDAKLRQKAHGDLVSITLEFEMMQSFLDVAKEESIKNSMVRTWVKHVRDLAYDVEDCVEFVVHLDNTPDWWRRLLPSCVAPPLPLDQAVQDLEELKRRVEDVNNCYRRYSNISDSGSSSKPLVMLQQPASAAAIVDTTAAKMIVEARDAAKRRRGLCDLTKLVMNEDGDYVGDLQVIAVWGTGADLGRIASVICKAYNEQQIYTRFTCRAWVKLTHPFNPAEFVQSLTADFHAIKYLEQQREVVASDVLLSMKDKHTKEFLEQLHSKRYLIVLEDLSSMAEWRAIRAFLPNRKNGSCIVVSMQQFVVASLCIGSPYELLELEQFSADHSVYAFIKKGSQFEGDKGEKTGDKRKAAEDWMTKHPLVGRESEMNDLRQYTKKARFYSFEVISVWGIPGVGKSALLKNLLCDTILNDCSLREKNKSGIFDKYAWVDVSYPFNLRDFSRSLLLNFRSQSLQANKDHDIDTVGSKNPIVECRGILEQGRCLVVIDGLQSTKEWDLIQAEVVSQAPVVSQAEGVSQSCMNCIIVITTEASIAKHCRGEKGGLVVNVKGLEAHTVSDLFKNEVSKHKHTWTDGYDVELQELISKCGGLPKVIVEIAGLLGRKVAARSINDKFIHHLENGREFDNLQGLFGWIRTYFHTCPDFLKPCIFYISIFPGDCPIRKRRLIRRWIAEGYSRDSHEESAEENGEKQFSNLLNLSIIQRTSQKIKSDTRMISVNGFIREYIVTKKMEENLCFELGASSTMTTQRSGRHLVILNKWRRDRIVFESMDFSRLRSLTVFGDWESYFISESMKLLRVLDLENAKELKDDDLKKMVKVLLRLKFLSLRGHKEIYHLPGSLHHLRQLQTLDVRGTSITTLPKKITKLQKLQYIRAGTMDFQQPVSSSRCSWLPEFCKCNYPTVGVEVPIGIGKVTALHTLGVVDVTASGTTTTVEDLKQLTQLRKLGVSGINGKNSKQFFSAIKDHENLESLSVRLENDNNNQGCLADMRSLPCRKLRSLKLYGIDTLPNWGGDKLRKLTKLELEMASLTDVGIRYLGELPQLCILRVKQLADGHLHFSVLENGNKDESYKKVKVLEIACSSIKLSVTFGSKTMKELERLKVDCPSASSFQFSGLNNLEELKEVLLVNGPNAETQKRHLESQLEGHPNENKPSAPKLKLEEPPSSS